MKPTTIRISGKRVFENQDELDVGHVEIEVEAYNILREIDSEDVADYARWSLDMKHENDFESNIEDFDEDELVEALEDLNFNFSRQIDEDECIEFLEDSGYIIKTPREENSLDYIDSNLLEEITNIFLNATVFERQEIFNKIKNA